MEDPSFIIQEEKRHNIDSPTLSYEDSDEEHSEIKEEAHEDTHPIVTKEGGSDSSYGESSIKIDDMNDHQYEMKIMEEGALTSNQTSDKIKPFNASSDYETGLGNETEK